MSKTTLREAAIQLACANEHTSPELLSESAIAVYEQEVIYRENQNHKVEADLIVIECTEF